MLLPIDAESPVAHPERQSGIDEHARITLQLLLHARAAEAWTLGQDLGTGATAKLRRAQHVLPGGNRLLEDAGLDLEVEAIVAADIAAIGDAALSMTEMLAEGEQCRAIAQRCEVHECLASLVGREPPPPALDTAAGRTSALQRVRSKRIPVVLSTRSGSEHSARHSLAPRTNVRGLATTAPGEPSARDAGRRGPRAPRSRAGRAAGATHSWGRPW